MAITAALVKELRERTSAGMMECKKALQETDGDMEAAIQCMRKAGLAKADKKANRIAAEGLVVIKTDGGSNQAVIVEVNCETDFVTKGDDFKSFVDSVAVTALKEQPKDIGALLETSFSGDENVADAAKALVVKIGEKITVRRYINVTNKEGVVGSYLHGARIGVLVDLSGGDLALAKDIAMHIAASNPICLSADDVPENILAKEKEIFVAQAAESGKPPEIVEKMVAGKIKKYLKEVTLLGQPFVKDSDLTIEKLLSNAGATVNAFHRIEVGEGIEKKDVNFADEVRAQIEET